MNLQHFWIATESGTAKRVLFNTVAVYRFLLCVVQYRPMGLSLTLFHIRDASLPVVCSPPSKTQKNIKVITQLLANHFCLPLNTWNNIFSVKRRYIIILCWECGQSFIAGYYTKSELQSQTMVDGMAESTSVKAQRLSKTCIKYIMLNGRSNDVSGYI